MGHQMGIIGIQQPWGSSSSYKDEWITESSPEHHCLCFCWLDYDSSNCKFTGLVPVKQPLDSKKETENSPGRGHALQGRWLLFAWYKERSLGVPCSCSTSWGDLNSRKHFWSIFFLVGELQSTKCFRNHTWKVKPKQSNLLNLRWPKISWCLV